MGPVFARRLPIRILEYRSYLEGLKTLLGGVKVDQVPIYVLSDYPRSQTVWTNHVFWLSKLEFEATIVTIDSPNGIESVRGKNFLWIGDQPTKMFIFSDRERTVTFNSEAVVMGPSIVDSQSRTLCAKSENAVQELKINDRLTVSLQLRRGMQQIDNWCKDKPEILRQPDGDARIMLLGLLNYKIEMNDASSSTDQRAGTR